MPGSALDELALALAALLQEARTTIAAGEAPRRAELEARLRGAASRARAGVDAASEEAVDALERGALTRLEGVLAVYRARQRVAAPPEAPPPPAPPRPQLRSALKTRPTITGTLDVRRSEREGTLVLSWDASVGVAEWEVRFSERPRPGADYVVLETRVLPPEQTSVEVPVGERVFRVNILGRSRDGRPRTRAMLSGLTRESWKARLERRATAS